MKEIQFELANETSEGESHYVLYDMAWHGDWGRDHLATALIPALKAKRKNSRNLGYLLSIVQGSSISDGELATIAARKASTKYDPVFSAVWLAYKGHVDAPADDWVFLQDNQD
ncbi:hypothetical protein [Rhizobium pisi]|uniref:hypothetical protein n=1 Tax=Rhizobium pisi TaxID=574561 RepID=UPI003D0906D1